MIKIIGLVAGLFCHCMMFSQIDCWTPKNTAFSIVTLPTCYKTVGLVKQTALADHPISAWRNFKEIYFNRLPVEIRRKIIKHAIKTADTIDTIDIDINKVIIEKKDTFLNRHQNSSWQKQISIYSQKFMQNHPDRMYPPYEIYQTFPLFQRMLTHCACSDEDRAYLLERFKEENKHKVLPKQLTDPKMIKSFLTDRFANITDDFFKILYYKPAKHEDSINGSGKYFPIYTEGIREWPTCPSLGGVDFNSIHATPCPNKCGDLLVGDKIINVHIQKNENNLRDLDKKAISIGKWCYVFCVLNPQYSALAKMCSQTHEPMNFSGYEEFLKNDVAPTNLEIITWNWKQHSKATKTIVLDQLLSHNFFKQVDVFNQLAKAYQEFRDHGKRRREGATYLFDNPLYTCQVESIQWVERQHNLLAITFRIAQWIKHTYNTCAIHQAQNACIDNMHPCIESNRFLLLLDVQLKQNDIDITIRNIRPLKKINQRTSTIFEYLAVP